MKYNKTQNRFYLGLGLYFSLSEDNGKIKVSSNIPELDMRYLLSTKLEMALMEIVDILYHDSEFPKYHSIDESKDFIKENNIKELL